MRGPRIRESVLSNDLSICPGIEFYGAAISDDSFQSAADPTQISPLTTRKIPPEARLCSFWGEKHSIAFFFPELPLLSLALCFIIPEANNKASISSSLLFPNQEASRAHSSWKLNHYHPHYRKEKHHHGLMHSVAAFTLIVIMHFNRCEG